MKVRKAIKRIMALSTGAAMLGATMFGAMAAADLANYPSPLFIKDGVFDGVLGVGDNAAAEDIIGITNIATSLQAASVKKKVVETGGVVVDVEGDAKKIGTSSNFLEFGEGLNDAGMTTVDSGDLAALADGSFQNSRGTFTYTQSVDLADNASIVYYKDSDQSEDPALYLKFFSGQPAYTYRVSFTPGMESEHDSSNNLKDFRDKAIQLFGKDYSIVTATNGSAGITLTLFSGAVTDILAEGSSKTYTIKGKDYDVTVTYISTTEALFTVNGETTDKLLEGETYRLADGTEVGVRDILSQNYAGETTGGDKVQFSLGAQKVKIVDASATTSNWGATVQVGNEDLNNVNADIIATGDTTVKVSELRFKYEPSSNLYVPVGGSLSASADEEEGETGNVIFNGFDLEFKGLSTGTTETLKVEPDSTTRYNLRFTNRNGDAYNIPIWSAMSDTAPNVLLGDWDGSTYKQLHVNESETIADEDYFLLSPSATQKTHIMQFKSVNTNDNTLKVKDMMSGGSTWEINNATQVTIDGTAYTMYFVGSGSTATMRADLNGDGDSASALATSTDVANRIYTRYSGSDGYLQLQPNGTTVNQSANFSNFVTEKSENMPPGSSANTWQESINWTLTWDAANDKLKLNSPTTNGLDTITAGVRFGSLDTNMEKLDGKDIYEGWSYFGVWGQYDYTNSDQPTFEFTYPDNQAEVLVYITSGATTSTEGSSGGLVTEVVQKIDVGAVKLASEITTPSASNLILVGGPCANSAARQVMGVTSANCAEGFEPGKAMIKLYEHAPGKVAMVVAGATAVDTRRASQVVANYKDYAADLKGAEVVVTTVTSTPTVAMPEAVAEDTTMVDETETA
ncbi:MAG: hypothetical protein QS98_C0011G0064 [archaeon GW2011_AR3]|nr:MAG: hypothetical protein QS98_C0011G0064 [archaeon GW2011_AR3]MBS3109673.1 hypothetical protein [Candidatus Woesearchaeota archaeon]